MDKDNSNLKIANSLLKEVCEEYGFEWNQIISEAENDLDVLAIRCACTIYERPKEHSILAGALQMWDLYKSSPLKLSEYLDRFGKFLTDDVVAFIREHEDALMEAVSFREDFRMGFLATATMKETYLSRIFYYEKPLEIPQFLFVRIAVGLFCHDGLEMVIKMLNRYNRRQGIPASPTIFNLGFKDGVCASCILDTIQDDLEDIYEVIKQSALASKKNAGIGLYLGDLRHSGIGRSGKGKGIIPLTKIIDNSAMYVDQGGRRPGAYTLTLRICHYDIPEFVRLLDPTAEDKSRVDKVQLSITLCDLFMERCRDGGQWMLFCPKQTPKLNNVWGKEFTKEYIKYEKAAERWNRYQFLEERNHREVLAREFPEGKPDRIDNRIFPARDIMKSICQMQCLASGPYIIHSCNANRKNNMCNTGMIKTSNLCQEIMIPSVAQKETGCCILSSISLKAFVKGKQYDYLSFGECVRDFIVALNRVVDATTNVSAKVMKSNKENRPIGLGVSGLADALLMLEIPAIDITSLPKKDANGQWRLVDITLEAPDYDEEALLKRTLNPEIADFIWMLWSCMYYNALLSSMEEAKKHGPYPNFKTSPAAQGRLQYHLWREEEQETGRHYPFRLHPCDPQAWGQEGSWEWLIEEIKEHGLRNALLLTCMPTASTSQLLNNCESIEFFPHHIFNKRSLSGEYPIVNYYIQESLEKLGLWTPKIFNIIMSSSGSILSIPEDGLSPGDAVSLRILKELGLTQFELPQRLVILLASIRQVFIDHSQSLNLYITKPNPEKMAKIHQFTWECGLKTGMYYLRTRSSANALYFKPKELGKKCYFQNDQCLSCS